MIKLPELDKYNNRPSGRFSFFQHPLLPSRLCRGGMMLAVKVYIDLPIEADSYRVLKAKGEAS